MKTRDLLVVYPYHNTSLRGRRGAPRLNEHLFPLPRRAVRVYEHRYRVSGRDAKRATHRVLRKLSHCPRFLVRQHRSAFTCRHIRVLPTRDA